MTTITATATTTFTRICRVCSGPSTEAQGLVLEVGGYVHAACSDREYQLVTEISFPSDEDLDPEPDPTSPAPALPVLGFDLCADCVGLSFPFAPGELCPVCQQAANDYEQDHYTEPDWDERFERYQAAKDYYLIAA